MPKVSVVTGYYNRAPLLDDTIASVLAQTGVDFELIVFDDASTDGTADRLRALADRLGDPRLRPLIHTTNKGFTRGMIDAIAEARGEYIAVQGSGDVSLPGRLARQAAVLDGDPGIGVVGCWYTNVVAESGAARERHPDANGMTFERLITGNVFSHGEVMFRRSDYDRAGGYRAEFRNCQDYDLWLRMVRICRFATVPELLYRRFVRSDGVSYAPKSVPVQARYFLLAQRIARMDDAEARQTLARLGKEGPRALVADSDPALQKRLQRQVLRAIAWGATGDAKSLAAASLTGSRGAALSTLADVLGSPVMRPVLSAARRVLGVS